MFEKLLRFFVNNSRLNYFLFILLFLTGIVLYTKTPKEIFPSFELDMVSINGHYTGSSIDMLDKMAVKEIESGLQNIDGIDKMSTINLKKAKNMEEIFMYASKRFRPIILTSITTLIGLSSLVFFPTG